MTQWYAYQRRELHEPEWQRIPGWRDVTVGEWEDAQWQRAHCVKNLRELKDVMGGHLTDTLYEDLERDQAENATMSMLLPPQMLNTIAPEDTSNDRTIAWYQDPIRRYMLPVATDRLQTWRSHPYSTRDSLHEHDMWAVEGLTHRYPTKVLAELLTTCPQYCGHCTRMDLVGNSTAQVQKLKLLVKPGDRHQQILEYLQANPQVRDVVVSGGDVANMPWPRLEAFLEGLLALGSIRDIRLATKALMGIPQHWLQGPVLEGVARVAARARAEGVALYVHTHINHMNSITPLVTRAAEALLHAGIRDVRNQGVLLDGVNTTPEALLDLSFTLQDNGILPYYLYMCDMIPSSEHWRIPVRHAQELQEQIMGWLPGYATPRIVCDVPFVGKRWVHQASEYDETRGISWWKKSYHTRIEEPTVETLTAAHPYYDPIHTLPEEGQKWWETQTSTIPTQTGTLQT